MPRKTSPAREAAFFAALRETGNQSLAAERARVSYAWVYKRRCQDPDFQHRLTAALAEAKARLRTADGQAPPNGWRSVDGEELVIRGCRGRRTQIARARLRQWTPRIEERFLTALAATCNVTAACAEIGLTVDSAYGHRKRWPRFAERWDAALETGYLRVEALLLERSDRSFPGDAFDPGAPMPPVTFDQGLQLLRLYKSRMAGLRSPYGHREKAPDMEKVRASILRKIEMVERADRVLEAKRKRGRWPSARGR